MTKRDSPKRGKRRGAASVEFAMTIPLLFLIVFGIFEFGRAFMVIELLGDAARVGCREGAIQGKSSSTISSDIQSRLQGEGVSGSTATVTVDGAAGETTTAASGAAITVTVTAPVSSVSWVNPRFLSGNLSGQATLEKE